MINTKQKIQTRTLNFFGGHTPFLTVWVNNGVSTYQLLNRDRSPCHIRQENATTNKELALLDNYSVESTIYRVSIIPDSNYTLSPNYTYYISRNNGTTLKQVQWISSKEKAMGALFHIWLMAD